MLILVGSSAIYGGLLLMLDPSGGLMKLPFTWIRNTPFVDYFIPGLILFIVIGALSIITATAALINTKHHTKYIFLQGSIYVGWIIIQMISLQAIFWLQLVVVAIGLLLMFLAGIENIMFLSRADT